MCSIEDPKHCQTNVYFDCQRPPTPHKFTESMWVKVNVLKQELMPLRLPPQCDVPPQRVVCTICTIIAAAAMICFQGSPYLQHRVATLLVQHGRRHQHHPTRNPFSKSCRFRLCLIQAAVVNLFVLNFVCFISVCPCMPETGRLENTYSCCGFWLWSGWLLMSTCLS